MSYRWGIYPETAMQPRMWWGARAIITTGHVDLLWDRQSNEGGGANRAEMDKWINDVAMPCLDKHVKMHDTAHIEFDSEDGKYHCCAEDHDSGGYLYIGCWTNINA